MGLIQCRIQCFKRRKLFVKSEFSDFLEKNKQKLWNRRSHLKTIRWVFFLGQMILKFSLNQFDWYSIVKKQKRWKNYIKNNFLRFSDFSFRKLDSRRDGGPKNPFKAKLSFEVANIILGLINCWVVYIHSFEIRKPVVKHFRYCY